MVHPPLPQTAPDFRCQISWRRPRYPTVSERTGTAGRATSRPAAMRGQAMAAGVVPASVTAYASSRSRFLGARLERARRRERERVRACARFPHPRTGGSSRVVSSRVRGRRVGSDVPASGSSRLPSQKIPPLYVKRTVRSSTVRTRGPSWSWATSTPNRPSSRAGTFSSGDRCGGATWGGRAGSTRQRCPH